MVYPIKPRIGGWYPGRIQLGPFIRDFLSGGQESWEHEIYQAYKKAAKAIPVTKGKRKLERKVISFEGFRAYMHMLRKLGLVEYLRTPTGEIDTEEAVGRGGQSAPYLAPRHFVQAVMSRIGDSAWQNPRRALYG